MASSGVLLALAVTLGLALAGDRPNLEASIEFEWNQIEYRYRTAGLEAKYNQDPNFFIPENAMLSGIAVHDANIYVTIPRTRSEVGVPWVLGWVPKGYPTNQPIRPFPNWDLHTVGDCTQLQNPMAMEVDHNTHLLYVVDSGNAGVLSANQTIDPCPAKIVVYNLVTRHVVNTHNLPEQVVPRHTSLLTSIVLDYTVPHSDVVRFAYIADAGANKLIVYDFVNDQTWSYSDPSTMTVHETENITINAENFQISLGLSGLALSPDFNYLYYSSMWNQNLYQVPTWVLRSRTTNSIGSYVRYVGKKASNTDDMVHGKDSLYYGALTRDAIYRWEKRHDMMAENVPEDMVTMTTQTQLVQNWESLQWPDSLCLDKLGNLWFTTSRAHLFYNGHMDFVDSHGPNFRIFKLNVNDFSYLQDMVPSAPVVG